MNEPDKDAEELMKQQKSQRRHQTEADSSTGDNHVSRQDAIVEAYQEIDAGQRPQNLTVRDENLAALLGGLETAGELDAILDSAYAALDRDAPDETTRANALRGLIRVGIAETAPELIDEAAAARKEYLVEQDDAF